MPLIAPVPARRFRLLLLFALFGLLTGGPAAAQTNRQLRRLADLGRVWGELKYFHPGIATGRHDWDSVLVAAATAVLQQDSDQALRSQVDALFALAGPTTAAEFVLDPDLPAHATRNIRHDWVRRSAYLTPAQQTYLLHLYAHPYQGVNYYAQNNPDDEGNIITPHEKPYPAMKLPSLGYRLVGLFRFWNVINYYYPYKYATRRDWDVVLTDLLPLFVRATTAPAYHRAVLTMAATIDDGHGGVYPFLDEAVAGKYRPPFYFQLVRHRAVVTQTLPGCPATIRVGSVISHFNGVSLRARVRALWAYIPASNPAGKYRDLHKLLLNSPDTLATYAGHTSDGRAFSTTLRLQERSFLREFLDFYAMTSPFTVKQVAPDVAYVYAANLTARNLDSVMRPLLHTKAIILDLRNYPNRMPSYDIARYFLSQPTLYSKQTRNDFRYPGLLVYENTNAGTSAERVGRPNPTPYQGKLLLLVDYRTQSLAEFDCLILQTFKNTVVIGNQTAGADGNQTRMLFPGGYKVLFSGFGIYYPNGGETQHVGIRLDVPVRYEVSDVAAGKDPLLEKALKYLQK